MFMKLTRFTDYALRVLIYLGLQQDGRVTIREISDAYGISRNHLMKVVSNLTRLGYLDARRGPGGGLSLSRPPSEINLAAVVRDMEEDMILVTCLAPDGTCTIKPSCVLKGVIAEALNAFMGTLETYNLQDLLVPRKPLAKLLHLS